MTRQQHLLIHAMEECNEVSQRISKALRFGLEQVQQASHDKPEQNPRHLTNKERIVVEFNDLVGVLMMVGLPPEQIIDPALMLEKVKKVERYLMMAKALGTLDDD